MRPLLKPQNFFIFFIFIISLSKANSSQETLICNSTISFDINEVIQYSLKVLSDFDSQYIKIEVAGNSKEINYILSAYSDISRTNRIQLAQGYNGQSKLYLAPGQKIGDEIYFDLECSKYPCSGRIENSYSNDIELKEGEPLNYYVSNSNLEMKFSLTSKENSEISNVWARGQLGIITELSLSSIKKDENYYIVTEKMNKQQFIVRGTVGDYINVGFIGYKVENSGKEKYYISQTNLIVDEAVLTGYLKKGSLESVCYPILMKNKTNEEVNIYGTGIILTKIAYSFFSYKNEIGTNLYTSIGPMSKEGYLEFYISSKKIQDQYFCVAFPPEYYEDYRFSSINEIVFTYQLTQGLTQNSFNLYEPQIRGIIYPRIINKNSKIALIPQNNGEFEKMNMDLLASSGFPKMTIVQCENFPICSLTDNSEKSPMTINKISSYTYKKLLGANYSPISKSQTLFVVECTEGQKIANEESNYINDYCLFYSLMYSDNNKVELSENIYYNKYAPKGQTNYYKIKLQHESKIESIFIDVIFFSGEVIVTQDIQDGITCNQYTSINKINLIDIIGKPSENLTDITFSIKAASNSYYTVFYRFGRSSIEWESLKVDFKLGMSYLVTMDNRKMDFYVPENKVLVFKKDKNYNFIPYMINFYSLNCEVEVNSYSNVVQRDQALTNNFGSYIQDIINLNDVRYNSSYFGYRIKVSNPDYSQYNGKLCKVYASAIGLSREHDIYTRDILIPDNIPQQIMFGKNLTHISYGYINVYHDKDLLIKFRPYHIAQYKLKIYFNGIERESGAENIIDKGVIYINHEEWANECNNNITICYIQLDITLVKTKGNEKEEPILEFSIKSIGSSFVTYIKKNVMKIDYIQNNQAQYYYTELGSNENGFITLNFFRGSGKVYGKIVSKNITEQNPDWRGKYKLPNEDDLIVMDPFTKKSEFYTYDSDCNNGCYLLLTVKPDVENIDIEINRNYPYSIIVHSSSRIESYIDIPIISIPLDEYVIGTVDPIEPSNRMFQFYSVWLNSDSEEVIIDLQSNAGVLFINVGDERPTVETSHFNIVPQNKDTIHSIPRSEILAKGNLTTLKNAVLTLGIWTNSTDNIYTTLFAFIVRLGNGKKNNIYKVNSDQKALCKTKKLANGKNRCLYVIDYDFISDINNIFIYASVQTKSAFYRIYGNYINASDYEMSNEEELEKAIPKEGYSKFSSKEINADYLYIPDGLSKDTYLLVSVETDKETIVELMSTFFSYQKGVTPNPSSPQLFMALSNVTFSLNFPKSNMVMANIRGMGGSAEIYWEGHPNHKYYLKGRDYRLSLSSYKSDSNHKLLITPTSNMEDGNGFVFYTTYGIKADDINFDSLILDKSVNYVYSENDFPIIYYTPINISNMEEQDYYEIFFSFNILEDEKESNLTYYEIIPFEISSFIVSKDLIYEAKLTPDITIDSLNKITGIYDQALRTGYIKIQRKSIFESKIKDRPYLYLKIEKSDIFRDIRKYKRISLETTAIRSWSRVTVSEISYQIGKLSKNQTQKEYLLRTDEAYKYIILQFSSSFETLTVKIKEDKFTLKEILNKYGKKIYLIDTKEEKPKTITLVILRKEENKKRDSYFMFQYINTNQTTYSYSISNTEIKVNLLSVIQDKANYRIEFSPVNNYQSYDGVNYIIRIYTDSRPNNLDLALKNGLKQNVKEFYNPKVEKGKIKIEIYNCSIATYFQVIAQIKNKEKVEYLSYDLNKNLTKKNLTLTLLIIIGTILFGVVITLIIVVILFNKKNKSLLNKVNKISFVNDGKEDENFLITSED